MKYVPTLTGILVLAMSMLDSLALAEVTRYRALSDWRSAGLYDSNDILENGTGETKNQDTVSGDHCSPMCYSFGGPVPCSTAWYVLSSGPGAIDSCTGWWCYAPSIADVGQYYTVVVSLSNSSDIMSIVVTFVNEGIPTFVSGCGEEQCVAFGLHTYIDMYADPIDCDPIRFFIDSVYPSPVGDYAINPINGFFEFWPDFGDFGTYVFTAGVTDELDSAFCDIFVAVNGGIAHGAIYVIDSIIEGTSGTITIGLENNHTIKGFTCPLELSHLTAFPYLDSVTWSGRLIDTTPLEQRTVDLSSRNGTSPDTLILSAQTVDTGFLSVGAGEIAQLYFSNYSVGVSTLGAIMWWNGPPGIPYPHFYDTFDICAFNVWFPPTQVVSEQAGPCCNGDGIRGNVDKVAGVGGEVDVADLTFLVAYLFQGGAEPPCMDEGNVDGIEGAGGPVDVADLTYLVAYLFQGGPAPVACP